MDNMRGEGRSGIWMWTSFEVMDFTINAKGSLSRSFLGRRMWTDWHLSYELECFLGWMRRVTSTSTEGERVHWDAGMRCPLWQMLRSTCQCGFCREISIVISSHRIQNWWLWPCADLLDTADFPNGRESHSRLDCFLSSVGVLASSKATVSYQARLVTIHSWLLLYSSTLMCWPVCVCVYVCLPNTIPTSCSWLSALVVKLMLWLVFHSNLVFSTL